MSAGAVAVDSATAGTGSGLLSTAIGAGTIAREEAETPASASFSLRLLLFDDIPVQSFLRVELIVSEAPITYVITYVIHRKYPRKQA
jgi:hypothetical protein